MPLRREDSSAVAAKCAFGPNNSGLCMHSSAMALSSHRVCSQRAHNAPTVSSSFRPTLRCATAWTTPLSAKIAWFDVGFNAPPNRDWADWIFLDMRSKVLDLVHWRMPIKRHILLDWRQTEVSQQVLELLGETHAWNSRPKFSEVLEAYRAACCSACLTISQLSCTLDAWIERLEHLSDELPIWVSAVHRGVAEWVCANWSIEWLCGTGTCVNDISLALFRQSREVLTALDFRAELGGSPQPFVQASKFLLCSERHFAALAYPAGDWEHCFALERVRSTQHGYTRPTARDTGAGHLLFCLDGVRLSTGRTAIDSECDFAATMESATLFQDVSLLLAQLWKAETPFVAFCLDGTRPSFRCSFDSQVSISQPVAGWCWFTTSLKILYRSFCFTFFS